jgi:ABC-type nitrate/sulfonate/bicarbonate transport system ATPase subunit
MQQAIVLIGNTGSGKRTLFKKIINVEINDEGNDDNVSVGCAVGRKFMIFNTPGLGGQSNKVYRVAGILAAL